MHSAYFFKTEAIDSPRIAPERESPRLMEPLETMGNQQGWSQSHGPSGRGIKDLGWGGTRRGAAAFVEETTASQISEGWGWRGVGRWRWGRRSPGGGGALHLSIPLHCCCFPPPSHTHTLVPSPELLNFLFLSLFPSPSSSLFRCLSYLLVR